VLHPEQARASAAHRSAVQAETGPEWLAAVKPPVERETPLVGTARTAEREARAA
jgi:hypothetical protein